MSLKRAQLLWKCPYDNSHTPQNFVAASLCFRVLFFLGCTVHLPSPYIVCLSLLVLCLHGVLINDCTFLSHLAFIDASEFSHFQKNFIIPQCIPLPFISDCVLVSNSVKIFILSPLALSDVINVEKFWRLLYEWLAKTIANCWKVACYIWLIWDCEDEMLSCHIFIIHVFGHHVSLCVYQVL